ncbi:hypothetical protein QTJ16_002684 [Diplocarpon rosae]|uniref:Uncharacterized protein n=1 Tax=Diplocarpon rosae TaxID=946125 RepID=A0AAD9WF92_9HELO|nr:hypothetical protein QTJ16_002684 [Diplocarpon rosae]
MDNKTPLLPLFQKDEAAPPSYADTISSLQPTVSSPTSQYYSSQIQSQLATLATLISSIQTQKNLLSHAQDEKILGLLTHHIQAYLSDFANTGLTKGRLILVPAQGIQDPTAIPTDYDFSEPSEYYRVVKISSEESGGQESWYWHDEDMAKRLARYLRPARDARTKEQAQLQGQPQPQTKGWGLFGRKKTAERSPLAEGRKDTKSQSLGGASDDRVVADVKAEETVFRHENEYGMYEAERGWGIVVTLRLVLANS